MIMTVRKEVYGTMSEDKIVYNKGENMYFKTHRLRIIGKIMAAGRHDDEKVIFVDNVNQSNCKLGDSIRKFKKFMSTQYPNVDYDWKIKRGNSTIPEGKNYSVTSETLEYEAWIDWKYHRIRNAVPCGKHVFDYIKF